MGLVCDDGLRLQYFQDRLDAGVGRFRVKWYVEVAAHVDASEGLYHVTTLGDIDTDG